MNEARTRLDLIDLALKAADWGAVEGSGIQVEFSIADGLTIGQKKRKHPLSADYVLDHADRLNIRYTYATNGQKIYGVDMDEGVEGDIEHFLTPEELWEMTFPKPKKLYKQENADWRTRFEAVPFALFKGPYLRRYFQHVAIEKTLDAITAKQDRIPLTMTTGTDKTTKDRRRRRYRGGSSARLSKTPLPSGSFLMGN